MVYCSSTTAMHEHLIKYWGSPTLKLGDLGVSIYYSDLCPIVGWNFALMSSFCHYLKSDPVLTQVRLI